MSAAFPTSAPGPAGAPVDLDRYGSKFTDDFSGESRPIAPYSGFPGAPPSAPYSGFPGEPPGMPGPPPGAPPLR